MKNKLISIILCMLLFLLLFSTINSCVSNKIQTAKNNITDDATPVFSDLNKQALLDDTTSLLWYKTYGGRSRDVCWSIIKTNDEGFLLIGSTDSFDIGGGDAWIVKLDKNGNEQWNNTYGGTRGDYAFDGVQTTDGGYIIAGGTKTFSKGDHDVWLFKIDTFGNEQWNTSFGGTQRDQGYAIIESSNGGFIICGGSGSFTEGPNDYWVIKTDEHGNQEWNRTYGNEGYDWGYDIIETSDGIILFTGGTDTSVDHSHILDIGLIALNEHGELIWDAAYNKPPAKSRWDEGYCLLKEDTGFLIAGIAHTYHWFEDGEGDGWIIKTNPQGKVIWDRVYGGDLCDGISSIKPAPIGGYIASGWTYSYGAGDADIWVLKLDEQGYVEWDATIGEDDYEWSMLHTIEVLEDGTYIVAGTTESYDVRRSDMFIAALKEPQIVIDFKGGLGFSFQIKNNDDNDLTDLTWKINLSRSIQFATSQQGSIDILSAGEQTTITNQKFFVGFGEGTIRFSIGSLGKTVHCLVIGPIVLLK